MQREGERKEFRRKPVFLARVTHCKVVYSLIGGPPGEEGRGEEDNCAPEE